MAKRKVGTDRGARKCTPVQTAFGPEGRSCWRELALLVSFLGLELSSTILSTLATVRCCAIQDVAADGQAYPSIPEAASAWLNLPPTIAAF